MMIVASGSNEKPDKLLIYRSSADFPTLCDAAFIELSKADYQKWYTSAGAVRIVEQARAR